MTLRIRSSNSPRYLLPAIIRTDPASEPVYPLYRIRHAASVIRSASPSTIAVCRHRVLLPGTDCSSSCGLKSESRAQSPDRARQPDRAFLCSQLPSDLGCKAPASWSPFCLRPSSSRYAVGSSPAARSVSRMIFCSGSDSVCSTRTATLSPSPKSANKMCSVPVSTLPAFFRLSVAFLQNFLCPGE